MYEVTKTYGHEEGLSCVFRQWRATSHCSQLHGYSLAFAITFRSPTLDVRNWVMDYGGLTPVRDWLHQAFDHCVVVALDDPERYRLMALGDTPSVARVVAQVHVGTEAFAEVVAVHVQNMLDRDVLHVPPGHTVRVYRVACREHGGNEAAYYPGPVDLG